MTAFLTVYTEYQTLLKHHQEWQRSLQAEYDAKVDALIPAFRARSPKLKRMKLERLKQDINLSPEAKEIYDVFKPRADEGLKTFTAQKSSLQDQLCGLAEKENLDDYKREDVRCLLESFYTGSYRSTGSGEKYSRAEVAMLGERLTAAGIEYWIEESPATINVFVGLDAVGVEVWKRRSYPLREWVKGCWRRGVNPRVYNPFLPHGYEERVGLDYFGNEKVTA